MPPHIHTHTCTCIHTHTHTHTHTHACTHIRAASLPGGLKGSRSQQNSPDTSSTGSNTSSSSIGSIQLSRQASDPGVDPSRSAYLHHQSSPSQRHRTSSGSQDSVSQQSAALMSQTQTEVGNGGVWVAWVPGGREPATVTWVGRLRGCCHTGVGGWSSSLVMKVQHGFFCDREGEQSRSKLLPSYMYEVYIYTHSI